MIDVEAKEWFDEIWESNDSMALIQREEGRAIFDIARELPKGSLMVELGCYEGKSTSILAAVADKNNLKLYCVDPLISFPNGGVPTTEHTLDVFRKNVLDVYKNIEWAGHKITSNQAAGIMNEPVDYIFIDADHSYSSCIQDCRNWMPKLKPGCLATFHDINNVAFIGILHAVEEYCVGWEEFDSTWNLKTFRKPI